MTNLFMILCFFFISLIYAPNSLSHTAHSGGHLSSSNQVTFFGRLRNRLNFWRSNQQTSDHSHSASTQIQQGESNAQDSVAENCAICLNSNELNTLLSCGHRYHQSCIQQ